MSDGAHAVWNKKVIAKIRGGLSELEIGTELSSHAYAAKLTTGKRQSFMTKEIACLFRQIPEIERRDGKWILTKHPS